MSRPTGCRRCRGLNSGAPVCRFHREEELDTEQTVAKAVERVREQEVGRVELGPTGETEFRSALALFWIDALLTASESILRALLYSL